MTLSLFVLLAAVDGDVVTLRDAVATAIERQPQLRQAHENARASSARSGIALSPILPQLNLTGSYIRTTANFAARPGSVPQSVINASTGPSLDRSYDFWTFGLTLTQTLFDLGTFERWLSARASVDASRATEDATRQQIILNVRAAYFSAFAQNELLRVATETYANQQKHRIQIENFVRVGARPEIDLAQARTDEANAEVQKINADVAYAVAKAQLNQAMGVERDGDYTVEQNAMAAVPGETGTTAELLAEAIKTRPDVASLTAQMSAQERTLTATRAGYAPIVGANASLTEQGQRLPALTPNWSVGVSATWNLFGGLGTYQQSREAEANLNAASASRDALIQQLRVDIERARLNVSAMKAALSASDVALHNATERLRLAEGRYQNGSGSILELGDAQIATANAGAQRVQAQFNLALARAQLLQALGRDN